MSHMEITDSRLLHNGGSANRHVGCVGFVFGSGKLDNVTMDGCFSTGNGGAATIYTPFKVEFTNTVIRKSQAAVGGAFWIMESPDVAIQHVEIDGCKATGDGGGVAILAGAVVALTEVTMRDSHARGSGGCLSAAGSTLTLHHVVFDGCTGTDGGGLFVGALANVVASHLTISDCRVVNDGKGGGLAISGGVVHLHNGSISSDLMRLECIQISECTATRGGLIDVTGGAGRT